MKRFSLLLLMAATSMVQAQVQSECRSTMVPFAGIELLSCIDCLEFRVGDAANIPRFRSPPRIELLAAGSALARHARVGDSLVAIDGEPITTQAGANLLFRGSAAGVAASRISQVETHSARNVGSARVSLRRRGETIEVNAAATERCADQGVVVHSRAASARPDYPELVYMSGRVTQLRNAIAGNPDTRNEIAMAIGHSAGAALGFTAGLEARLEAQLVTLRQAQIAEEVAKILEVRRQMNMVSDVDLARAQEVARAADSALVYRAKSLYFMRAITRQEFEKQVGILRADSIIRASRPDTAAHPASPLRGGQQIAVAAHPPALIATVSQSDPLGDPLRRRLPAASLGIGFDCDRCMSTGTGSGAGTSSFSQYPVVRAVQPRSVAERAGLRVGDTLKTIDGLQLTEKAGAQRLDQIVPGQTLKLGWGRRGVAHSIIVTMPGTGSTATRASDDASKLVPSTVPPIDRGGRDTVRRIPPP